VDIECDFHFLVFGHTMSDFRFRIKPEVLNEGFRPNRNQTD